MIEEIYESCVPKACAQSRKHEQFPNVWTLRLASQTVSVGPKRQCIFMVCAALFAKRFGVGNSSIWEKGQMPCRTGSEAFDPPATIEASMQHQSGPDVTFGENGTHCLRQILKHAAMISVILSAVR